MFRDEINNLADAFESGDDQEVERHIRLAGRKGYVSSVGDAGITALQYSCMYKTPAADNLRRELLRSKADPNQTGEWGPALHMAAFNLNETAVDDLMKAKVNLNLAYNGERAVEVVERMFFTKDRETAKRIFRNLLTNGAKFDPRLSRTGGSRIACEAFSRGEMDALRDEMKRKASVSVIKRRAMVCGALVMAAVTCFAYRSCAKKPSAAIEQENLLTERIGFVGPRFENFGNRNR